MRAALDYVRNAATMPLLSVFFLEEAATQSPDPEIAPSRQQLIDSAVRLRAYALLSTAKLYVRMVFPDARLSYGRLADNFITSQHFGWSTYPYAAPGSVGSPFDLALRIPEWRCRLVLKN